MDAQAVRRLSRLALCLKVVEGRRQARQSTQQSTQKSSCLRIGEDIAVSISSWEQGLAGYAQIKPSLPLAESPSKFYWRLQLTSDLLIEVALQRCRA